MMSLKDKNIVYIRLNTVHTVGETAVKYERMF